MTKRKLELKDDKIEVVLRGNRSDEAENNLNHNCNQQTLFKFLILDYQVHANQIVNSYLHIGKLC